MTEAAGTTPLQPEAQSQRETLSKRIVRGLVLGLIIGFVGLVAPHVVRLLWGPDYRSLLPMAALVGAGFLILADLVARTIVSPGELPVGVVTAFCGAPFLLYLLRRRKRATM